MAKTTKTYNLSKQELEHLGHIAYAIDYLKLTHQQFVASVLTERLGYQPHPDHQVDYKLDNGKLTVVIDDTERQLYKPTDSE